jgi:MFS family permease
MVIHGGLNVLQYSICLSLLNPLLTELPHIFNWHNDQKDYLTGLVNSINTAGAAIGCISAGYLSALYGRRTLFIIGDIFCICGSILSLIGNYTASFIVGRFICGIGMGILVDLAILFVVEWTYYKYRGYAAAPMVCFTPLGLIFSSLLGLRVSSGGENYWKYVVSVPAIISGVHLFGYLFFFKKDSPFFTY